MLIGKADLAILNRISSTISDFSLPLLSVFSKQTDLVEKLIKGTGRFIEKQGRTLSFIQNFAFCHFI